MNNMIVRKLTFGLVALCAVAGLMVVTGCDSQEIQEIGQKIGGGGHLQNFSFSNGRYCN